jgi:hypothetical protein
MLFFLFHVIMCISGLLESVDSRIVCELDYRNPVLYVIPAQNFGKLPIVPESGPRLQVGDTENIPYQMRNVRVVPCAPGDCRPGACDGYRMWFVIDIGMVPEYVMHEEGFIANFLD